jgi:eukaryotic-like serine/threonine-protein kinase
MAMDGTERGAAATTVGSVGGGRYRLERLLGGGGMAGVYLGRDMELDRPVAVKLLAENLARDETFRERFLREARLSARLSHPNVVVVYDAGETEHGRPYIVMEQVEGRTLADVLRERGRLPHEEAVALALQACNGLAHAHEAGLVHRDVKPQNLLLRDDGTLKVADFGIARAAEETALTEIGTVLGTAAYLSPEQAAGEEVTAAADVYALGAVLYELLTGRAPYELESLADLAARHAEGTITPVAELAPDVPEHVEDAVMRALARNPAYRPASAGELARDLAVDTAPPPTRAAARVAPWRRRLRPVLAAVGGALTAVLLGVVLATRGGSSSTPPPQPRRAVAPVPHVADAQRQARELAAWLRRNSR